MATWDRNHVLRSLDRTFRVHRGGKLDILAIHDDQHGSTIVVLADVRNALRLVGTPLDEAKVVISGAVIDLDSGCAGDVDRLVGVDRRARTRAMISSVVIQPRARVASRIVLRL